jgi:hypothetical protein
VAFCFGAPFSLYRWRPSQFDAERAKVNTSVPTIPATPVHASYRTTSDISAPNTISSFANTGAARPFIAHFWGVTVETGFFTTGPVVATQHQPSLVREVSPS